MPEQLTGKIIDSFDHFFDVIKDVWNHGLFGVDIGSILIALFIFGFFLLLREFIGKIILRKIGAWAASSKNRIDDRIVPALIPPAKFIPVILGVFFAGQALNLDANGVIIFSRVIRSMVAFTIFWAVYLGLDPFSHSLKRLERLLTPIMTQWIFKVLKMLVVFIGTAVVLEIWGIEVAPMLAGLGLFGAAIALGAQNFFKNLIAGMSIISEKQFLDGDWILVEGVVEGTVEDIGFRSTTIRRADKAPIYVPNSMLADAVVTNFSRMSHRLIKWRFGVTFDTSIAQLKTIRDEIEKFLKNNSDVYSTSSEAGMTVRVDTFTATSIEFIVNCFTNATDYNTWVAAKEELALKVKEIVEDVAKTSFATPVAPVTINTAATGMDSSDYAPPEKKTAKF